MLARARRRSIVLTATLVAGALAGGAACRDGNRDGDSGGDADADGDALADSDFDEAVCDRPFPLGGACDPLRQGCCEPGERCTLVASGDGGAGPVEQCAPSGTGSVGTPCSDAGEEQCGAGATCHAGPFIDACARFCANSGDCPAEPLHVCSSLEATGNVYNVCVPATISCDPVARTGCPAGYACVLDMPNPRLVVTTCAPAGIHAPGEECSDGAGCAAGSGCYEVEGARSCYEICTLGTTCPSDVPCAEIGHRTLGLCPNPTS